MEKGGNSGNIGARKPILALGELLVDLVPGREGMRIEDAGPVVKTASGSAGIFACAATLLGGRGGFIGKVGRDSLSRMVAGTLRGQGVDLSRLIVSDEGQMGLAFLEYLPEGRNYQYYRKNSVGSLLRASELDAEYISGAYAVHFPGMLLELTEEMRGACERLVEIAREKGILVSFDPNIRRELSADAAARARLLWAVRHADVVAPTLSEGQMITGETSIGGVLSRGGEVAVAAGIDEEPVDPTGAGDTLAAALCVGLQEDMPLARLAAFCNCAGTLVIKKKGAIGMALPERGQVDAMVASGVCRVECMPLESLV